jgi:acetoin utilization deacetylase AcuC-like enzyme
MYTTGIAFDPYVRKHDPGTEHPEQPARFSAVMDHLRYTGLLDVLDHIDPHATTDDELALAHSGRYIELARHEVASGCDQLSTGDTAISPHSFECATISAGCGIAAVNAVISGRVKNAFCVVRPPGHHAEYDRGMGFCLFNNVAVAARYAQRRHGLERILIVDWDVHHGNGTQQIFYNNPSVMFFSTHQYPWYPGTGAVDETGEGKGEGTTINCPLPAGSGRKEIIGAFRERLVPAARHFQPELVLISAGFDSRINDPLGRFLLQDRDFAELTTIMMELAAETAEGRLVSILEGGYNLEGLSSAAAAHVNRLHNPL